MDFLRPFLYFWIFFGAIWALGYLYEACAAVIDKMRYGIGLKSRESDHFMWNPLDLLKEAYRTNYFYCLLLLLCYFGFAYGAIIYTIGNNEVGSFFEKPVYEAGYYVNISSNNDGVFIRTPAMIKAEYGHYSIDNVLIGGQVVFLEGDELKQGKPVELSDGYGRTWYVELTSQKYRK